VFSAGAVAEECEITVLGAGQLGSSPLFDTVSYNPSTGDQPAQKDKFLSFNFSLKVFSQIFSLST
jgi:hypothetical protein